MHEANAYSGDISRPSVYSNVSVLEPPDVEFDTEEFY